MNITAELDKKDAFKVAVMYAKAALIVASGLAVAAVIGAISLFTKP